MQHAQFDTAARRAGTIDRKTSLRVLGGALAGLTAAHRLADSAKGKGAKKGSGKCRKLEDPCRDYWQVECGPNATCREAMLSCCALLGACKGAQYFDCTSPNVVVE